MKLCPYCYRPITEEVLAEKRKRKADNARLSQKKAAANGNSMGRTKMFSRDKAKLLRAKGYSYRDIGLELGVSSTSIHRAIAHSPAGTNEGK